MTTERYQLKNKIRIVTAASLFDGHDAAINIMRRILQSSGAEVIHLGHDRSVEEVVNTAIQEDANAIAMTSYQGGHNEYFKYMYDLLKERGCEHIRIVGGGGGVILPDEIKMLQDYGITRIYSPDDGRALGLLGMIDDMLERCDFKTGVNVKKDDVANLKKNDKQAIARLISAAENAPKENKADLEKIRKIASASKTPVLGITGTGGAGKSSLVDELIRRFLMATADSKIAIVSVDPSKRKTGGALLGDRIRMNAVNNDRVYMRSLATRQSNLALSVYVNDTLEILKATDFDLIILETSGIGQSDTEIEEHSDVSLYVMTPEYGAATQLEKIDMLDFADIIALNKFDKRGALDALRDVKKQYKRNRGMFEAGDDEVPVYGTIASQFNDRGMTELYNAVITALNTKAGLIVGDILSTEGTLANKSSVIPGNRIRYLSEISESNRGYDAWVEKQTTVAQKLYGIHQAIETAKDTETVVSADLVTQLEALYTQVELDLDPKNKLLLEQWATKVQRYKDPEFKFKVRDKELSIATHSKSLSGSDIPKISMPKYQGWGDILKWNLQENVPGEFPYTAGLFPFKREGEDPTRMFAGEGGPERTNRRFHYVSKGMPAKRLSTAFDSVTLYGNDPAIRPDIYGKIGNAGVSICCLDDAKKLYSGFDLAHAMTSVSMTINGPAPMLLGFFLNTAIDQQCERFITENGLEKEVAATIAKIYKDKGCERPSYQGELPDGNDGLGLMLIGVTGDQVLPPAVYQAIKAKTLTLVRGTVQADILKEDQAQNTCIFSTEFALRLMGDVQEYFIEKGVRNFYSVSISGYHIAEAGANPITQLALTLANGFTFVEYYLSRGMDINEFGPNLSFFFSNGIDPEYAVIGRVARRIWSKAMKNKYGANARAQMLKYHIQTSGRSLHAQEIDFNDIRTTLQALYAINDNCNSLHTNAYDEAITTPTEDSVRRAMAIQLIINRELGLSKNENPIQGAFIIEELTDLVEDAVLTEFDRINERGGVLGAMETMYQRGKIQEESMYYEHLKHSGEYPIIGVNTFLSSTGSPTIVPEEVIRATEEEKTYQIDMLASLNKANAAEVEVLLKRLQTAAINHENIFELMMDACKVCSLGQIVSSLFEAGGQYRRNM
ncbi:MULTISPECIES: methylmalonyl-CoA mutase family protein [unclassified Colwellia]|jgi:methylmalonyl-CoA mutase|uniref:methylmalonyl-CoA mutase family protein n=1 Tax=unclassified Colwellia TaxID=196834 RepID=UPI0015F50FFC|nr:MULTISPECIES: methylmalonyl-CoA mutase family protein [unclassified Colwellia]MBA6362722.1 methylmalonyl-CoA mutase family protein [Colwellia sp. BRX8-8]MBA6339042.1 methylmalonyl-CoA mutase family protein [Colwellia sp. BRX8-7]MBA6350237.1 methylmalonyl-CoA mutase family protein [Colwellia sp. BRX8-9]MBA6354010.1 methylmalonyl-CoA mutase family protein [Colwellia sp. BRX9-1]MBA6357280.1 methylmalonyl-CoA mutase family protein [Colwellia sp. BRX8-3]